MQLEKKQGCRVACTSTPGRQPRREGAGGPGSPPFLSGVWQHCQSLEASRALRYWGNLRSMHLPLAPLHLPVLSSLLRRCSPAETSGLGLSEGRNSAFIVPSRRRSAGQTFLERLCTEMQCPLFSLSHTLGSHLQLSLVLRFISWAFFNSSHFLSARYRE